VPQTLVKLIAENMAIYAGAMNDNLYIPQAEELLRRFRAVEGRDATNYLKVEEWSLAHIDQKSGFLVLAKRKHDD
jgi:hypothetical protein